LKGKDEAAAPAAMAVDAEVVANELRTRIQRSDLPPGEWLREARLCSDFGVGRSIIRRALRILADDGLLEIEENRGARVRATSVEEVFDLYEVRAALYGLAARFACLRGSDAAIQKIIVDIDHLFDETAAGKPAERLIALSEAIFSQMAAFGSSDAQRMIEAIRRKTRFHFSYAALALDSGPGPFEHWRRVRAALIKRDANEASQASRDILYYMQGEVARIMLAHGPRVREDGPPPPPPARVAARSAGRSRRA